MKHPNNIIEEAIKQEISIGRPMDFDEWSKFLRDIQVDAFDDGVLTACDVIVNRMRSLPRAETKIDSEGESIAIVKLSDVTAAISEAFKSRSSESRPAQHRCADTTRIIASLGALKERLRDTVETIESVSRDLRDQRCICPAKE